MTPFEIMRVVEARQDAALAVHFAEAKRMREVRYASVAYWPRLLTPEAAYLEDEFQRVLAWRRAHPNWEPRYYPPVSPERRLQRLNTIVARRRAGATFKAIGSELGLTGARVAQILNAATRKLRRQEQS
jgi:hypothetical protein